MIFGNRSDAVDYARNLIGNNSLGNLTMSPAEKSINPDTRSETITGYPAQIFRTDYEGMYARTIGGTIIDTPPHDTYREWFEVKTKNDKLKVAIEEMNRELMTQMHMNIADKLQGLDGYSVIVIGYNDADLKIPPKQNARVEFLKPIRKHQVKKIIWESDMRKKSFGELKQLEIEINSVDIVEGDITETQTSSSNKTQRKTIHASRLLILSERHLGNPFDGRPMLERIYNYVQNLENLVWSGSEAFYQRVVTPWHVDYAEGPPEDDVRTDVDTQLDEFKTGLRQRISTSGVTIEPMTGFSSMLNPKPMYEILIDVMAGAAKIPKRVITGSQAGALASAETDKEEYYAWISGRQENFAEKILRELYTRQQKLGTLPEGEFDLEWNPLFEMSEAGIATMQKTRAETARILIGDPLVAIVDDMDIIREEYLKLPKTTLAEGVGTESEVEAQAQIQNQAPFEQTREEKELIDRFGFMFEREQAERKLKLDIDRVLVKYMDQTIEFLEENVKPELEEGTRDSQIKFFNDLIINQPKQLKLNGKPLENVFLSHNTAAFTAAGQQVLTALDVTTAIDILNPAAVNWLQQNALIIADKVTVGIEQQIRFDVIEAVRKGEGWGALKTKVAQTYGDQVKRSEVLARTEISKAVSEGSLNTYNTLGVEKVMWLAIVDDRTDDECLERNGKVFTLEEAKGAIPIHPNCRCTWVPLNEEDLPLEEGGTGEEGVTPIEESFGSIGL